MLFSTYLAESNITFKLRSLSFCNASAIVGIAVDALAYPFVGLVNGDLMEVTVVFVQGPDDIICQPVSSLVQLNDLMTSLQTSCQGKRCSCGV